MEEARWQYWCAPMDAWLDITAKDAAWLIVKLDGKVRLV